MEKELKEAIVVLAKKITGEVKADDALKYTQATTNLANTLRCLGFVKD